jgi:hypothetical protein
MGRLTYNGKMNTDSRLSVQPGISAPSSIDRGSSSVEMKEIIQSFSDTLRILLLTLLVTSWDSSGGDTSTKGTGGSVSMGLMTSMISLYEQMISQQIQNTTAETDGETTSQPWLVNTDLGIAQTTFHHINQFLAELQVGGDGRNSNCGPTSLVMALHQLGLRVAGETSDTSDGEDVDLARRSMVASSARDGVDANGNRVEGEHSTYTNFSDLARGAAAAGAKSQIIKASAAGIQSALQNGASVIASGTFVGKYPLPWTGDRGIDNNSAPGAATAHLIEVSSYDPSSNTFTIDDPARSQAAQVSAASLEHFMAAMQEPWLSGNRMQAESGRNTCPALSKPMDPNSNALVSIKNYFL